MVSSHICKLLILLLYANEDKEAETKTMMTMIMAAKHGNHPTGGQMTKRINVEINSQILLRMKMIGPDPHQEQEVPDLHGMQRNHHGNTCLTSFLLKIF